MAERGLEQIIDAVNDIPDVNLVLLGEGPLENDLRRRVRDHNLNDRIIFHRFVPIHQLISFISQADLGLSLLIPESENHRYALPNKFFEYIMAGVPVLASSIPTLEEYIRTYKVGRTVDPENRQQLAHTIQEMLNDPAALQTWKNNCRSAAKILNWEAEAIHLRKIYQRLI